MLKEKVMNISCILDETKLSRYCCKSTYHMYYLKYVYSLFNINIQYLVHASVCIKESVGLPCTWLVLYVCLCFIMPIFANWVQRVWKLSYLYHSSILDLIVYNRTASHCCLYSYNTGVVEKLYIKSYEFDFLFWKTN